MSERSSFVTEYLYCDKCFEELKSILLQNEKYLTGRVIEPFPIIAGKIGALGPAGEITVLLDTFYSNKLCHPIRIVILHDYGDTVAYLVQTDRIYVLGRIEYETQTDQKTTQGN